MTGASALLALAVAGSGQADSLDGGWIQHLAPNAEAVLAPGHYVGPWVLSHAVTIHAAGAVLEGGPQDGGVALTIAGTAQIDGLTVIAAKAGTGIRVQPGARADLRSVRISGPAQALLYAARAAVSVTDGTFEGGEYGVLAERPSELSVRGSQFSGQLRDAIAVSGGTATIAGNHFKGPFGEAALALLHVDGGQVEGNEVVSAGTIGFKLLGTRAVLEGDWISGARADPRGLEGNALYGDASELTLSDERFSDSTGAAVALIQAKATAHGLTIDGASEAAVYLERGGILRGAQIVIRNAPSGIVMEVGAEAPDGGVRFEGVATPLVQLPP